MTGSVSRTLMVGALIAGAAVASAQQIRVEVDGRAIRFTDTQPSYMQGRVLVPVRGVFEELGANVQWHPMTRTVTAVRGDQQVNFRIGERWATVDGRSVALDVPAQIMNGRTMVPLRFVSEALGAEVTWHDPTRTVMINSNWAQMPPPVRPPVTPPVTERPMEFRRAYTLDRGTVIPVTLETRITSNNNRPGDLVRARVQDFRQGIPTWERGEFDFPENTRLEGRVVAAIAQSGTQPGMVEMEFNRIVLPDGRTFNVNGSMIALDSENVMRNEAGVLVARPGRQDNRMVYAGYGAGAGLLIGLLTNRPLEAAVLGGLLGYLAGTVDRTQQPRNVVLDPGTRFGVRVDQDVTITLDPIDR
jgi:hypothetical protein